MGLLGTFFIAKYGTISLFYAEKSSDYAVDVVMRLLKCHYDENHIFPIKANLKRKQVACMRRKLLFTIFKYLFLFQRYSSFQSMQIS